MIKHVMIILNLLTMGISNASEITISQQLETCFLNTYHIPEETVPLLLVKCVPLLSDPDFYKVIYEFIEKSEKMCKKLELAHSKDSKALLIYDAVLQAAQWHEVLFENSKIRILWTVVKPNERESFHMHYWKSLMIIIQEADFVMEHLDGSKEKDDYCPIGVYELLPDTQPAAYTNISDLEFKSIRFEIKE